MSDSPIASTRFGVDRVVTLTFAMIRRNPAGVLLPSAAYAVIGVFLPQLVGQALAAAGAAPPAYLAWVPMFFINQVLIALVTGCVTFIVVGDLGGRPLGFGGALRGALPRLAPVAVLSLVISLALVLGLVLLVVPGILLILRWWVAVPVRFVEDRGFAGALGRSAALTKGHRGALFGLLAIVGILALVWTGVVIVGSGGLTAFQQLTLARDPVLLAVEGLFSAAVTAVSTTGSAVTYAELRRVKEGVLPGQLATIFE